MANDTTIERDPTEFRFPEGFAAALQFAIERHREDLRKGTGIPYITHPVIVAETLAYYYPDAAPLVVAAVLHDVVEDTETTIGEVTDLFGSEVARLVSAVTKPEREAVSEPLDAEGKKERWRRERKAMLKALGHEDHFPDVLRLKAADALANLRAIRRDLSRPGMGEAVWQRFKVGRDESLGYYRNILQHVERLADEPLVAELRHELEAVESTG